MPWINSPQPSNSSRHQISKFRLTSIRNERTNHVQVLESRSIASFLKHANPVAHPKPTIPNQAKWRAPSSFKWRPKHVRSISKAETNPSLLTPCISSFSTSESAGPLTISGIPSSPFLVPSILSLLGEIYRSDQQCLAFHLTKAAMRVGSRRKR